ncbi:hypothetical protein P8605_39510 [Streptomyces sp. T-3]|nr:hypothetical protein [Streptomyces sp. T-3]
MISINQSNIKLTDVDRSVVATCPLGISFQGTGLSGINAASPVAALGLPVLPSRERNERDERPMLAPEAAVATAQAHAYAFAAAGAGSRKQTTQQHMWAFRGLEPWSDPA